ncbi:recombinase family protein [Actinomadura parmotrematis]|uniref:Recombinase family protein n=1 Tax=Actinomadura parmotrematis TaxID=2864039 RepID=A0ABS7FSV8_9ACTN|nr:recombinase family protein [Actinomadura parmotrematis]MBW8482618.1 recombinase family protein [Actinomadura parmotrematis]
MTDRIYLRHSTDKQTDARQRHALAALIAAGAPAYDDPATSSRQLSLDRAGFTRLLGEAAVGDTIRIADAARLFRSVADILALRPVLIRRGLHLRVESGLLSGIDLAADDPGTKMMVSVLAAVLEFQRDMISENTRQGVAAAEASGKTLGRPTALDDGTAADIVTAYQEGTAVKALARQHHVAPKTIRRILDAAGARQLPADLATELDALPVPAEPPGPTANTPVTLDLPGLLADHLRAVGDDAIRFAVIGGRIIRRGKGYSIRLTVPLHLHQAALQQSAALAAEGAGSAERKAYRVYATRVTTAQQPRSGR